MKATRLRMCALACLCATCGAGEVVYAFPADFRGRLAARSALFKYEAAIARAAETLNYAVCNTRRAAPRRAAPHKAAPLTSCERFAHRRASASAARCSCRWRWWRRRAWRWPS
eukprot:scaffold1131_cov249-Prasinococcus_capsulatus_cf.AAC.2